MIVDSGLTVLTRRSGSAVVEDIQLEAVEGAGSPEVELDGLDRFATGTAR